MSSDNEFGEFLRARRTGLDPGTAGITPDGSRRRVRGMRREEVAALAAISTDYYTKLEQGRCTGSASESVLDALAQVLRMSEDERGYLLELAGKREREAGDGREEGVLPTFRRLIDDLASTPAVVLGPAMDILAWNPMAGSLFTDFGAFAPEERNFAWLLFTDDRMRGLYPEWHDHARLCTAMLRMESGRRPGEDRLVDLVGELSRRDTDFRRWWRDHHVARCERGDKHLDHPVAGELCLEWEALSSRSAPGHSLITWSAPIGSESELKLCRLAAEATATSGGPDPLIPVGGAVDARWVAPAEKRMPPSR